MHNLVGIGLTDEGIALACLSRDGESAFTLTHTSYSNYESIEEMAQQLREWVQNYQLKNKLTKIRYLSSATYR